MSRVEIGRVEVSCGDVAPVESESCPAGHPVPPGTRTCRVCGLPVGHPQPGQPLEAQHRS